MKTEGQLKRRLKDLEEERSNMIENNLNDFGKIVLAVTEGQIELLRSILDGD